MKGPDRHEQPIPRAAEAIDRLLTVDLATRGVINVLYTAARRAQKDRPLCMVAAERLADVVKSGDTVVIATGLPIRGWFSSALAESDGPAGAATLARALYVGLSAVPVLLCEEPMVPLLQAACRAAGLVVTSSEEWKAGQASPDYVPGRHIPPAIVESFPTDPAEAKDTAHHLLNTLRPAALISIERQGANEKGVYHYGKGEANLTSAVAKLDELFHLGRESGVLTVGLGDGGNELGLGLIRDEIRAAIPFGARCICPCGAGIAPEFAADVVVAATTSNWGAWGIEACLALLTGRREALHTEALERNVLRMCADHGAMDGITGFIEPDVDGIPGDICAHVVGMLGHIVTAALLSLKTQESVKMPREKRDR
jgi:hypothetical protein